MASLIFILYMTRCFSNLASRW